MTKNLKKLENLNFFSSKIKWDMIKNELKCINWKSLLEGLNCEDRLSCIDEKLTNLCLRHIPKKRKSGKRTLQRKVRSLFRKRSRLQKRNENFFVKKKDEQIIKTAHSN